MKIRKISGSFIAVILGVSLLTALTGCKKETAYAAGADKSAEVSEDTEKAGETSEEKTDENAETEVAEMSENESVTAEEELEDSPEWIKELPEANDADQLFVIAAVSGTTAYVSMHEKDGDGNWKEIITTPGYIGKKGLGKTREGDALTPVGDYHFTEAFGIADDPGCKMEYKKVTDDDYWSGDPREGYEYNKMVSIEDYPDLDLEDSEHIIDYTYQYQYCLNISYNEEGVPGAGSAIFLHCLGPYKPYTGGCVAIPTDKMKKVIQNVDEDCVVVINTVKNLFPSLYEEWGLSEVAKGESTVSTDSEDQKELSGADRPLQYSAG